MKLLQYKDDDGFIRHSLIRDKDDNPKYGIPNNPPDLSGLNITPKEHKELHNLLSESKIFTHLDVLKNGNGVTSILRRMGLKHLRRQVITLYKTRS